MSRSEEFMAGYDPRAAMEQAFKTGPLYHGTTHEFEPGDTIVPQSKDWAHATPHTATARVFAGGSKAVRSGQAHVYEVEPLDHDDLSVSQMRYTGNETHYEVTSRAGFQVKRRLPRSAR